LITKNTKQIPKSKGFEGRFPAGIGDWDGVIIAVYNASLDIFKKLGRLVGLRKLVGIMTILCLKEAEV